MATTEADPALFPVTPDERVANVRRHLEAAHDKAIARAEKAQEKVDQAAADLTEFDRAIEAVRRGE